MTTYILLVILIALVLVLIFKKPITQDLSPQLSSLREDNVKLRERIAERLTALSENAKDMKNIGDDIANFKNILMGNKQARGRFGERLLEDLVADAMPGDTFEFQCTLPNGARPDAIIKLPYPPGNMIIDAKFPLEWYDKMTNAVGEDEREFARKQFNMSVRKHIDDVAARYIIPGQTAESILIFIPAESIFADIHRELPDTIEYAARKKVFITSPATLWASLNTIRAVLSDIKIKRVAGEIKKELELLLADLGRLSDRADKVEKSFNNSVDALKDLNISINKITPRAEKLRGLDFE